MQYQEIACPRCSSLNIKKNGRTANHKQRYRCKDCGRQFITSYSYRGCQPEVRALIVPLTLNSSGIRDIARVLHVSPNTVLRRIRAAAGAVAALPVPTQIDDLEVDEFWSFVRTKSARALDLVWLRPAASANCRAD